MTLEEARNAYIRSTRAHANDARIRAENPANTPEERRAYAAVAVAAAKAAARTYPAPITTADWEAQQAPIRAAERIYKEALAAAPNRNR